MTTPPPGHRIGKIVVDLLTEGMTNATVAAAPHLNAERLKAITGFSEDMEREIAPLIESMVRSKLDTGQVPDWLAGACEEIAGPEHQWAMVLQVMALASAIGGAFISLGSIELQALKNTLWSSLPEMPMSPADVATADVRNQWTNGDPETEAANSGLNSWRYQTLRAIVGEPPGPVDMLSLWRRGLIPTTSGGDGVSLEQAVRESRLYDKYQEVIQLLAFSYMSPTDVVNLAIKGIVDPTTAQEMFGVAGGLTEQFEMLYQGAGDSIGIQQALNIMNHGIAFAGGVTIDEILGRSRINPIFYGVAQQTHMKWFSVIQIELMLKAGTVSQTDAVQWLLQDGYQPDQVAAFVAGASGGAHAKAKTETEAMIVEQYTAMLVSHDGAVVQLDALGYSDDQANAILAVADAKRAHAQLGAAISATRSAFVAGHITDTAARADLAQLDVPPDAVTAWLADWAVEKSTKAKTLTEAQVGGLMKKGVLSPTDAMSRWLAMGYSVTDCQLLAQDYGATAAAARAFSG